MPCPYHLFGSKISLLRALAYAFLCYGYSAAALQSVTSLRNRALSRQAEATSQRAAYGGAALQSVTLLPDGALSRQAEATSQFLRQAEATRRAALHSRFPHLHKLLVEARSHSQVDSFKHYMQQAVFLARLLHPVITKRQVNQTCISDAIQDRNKLLGVGSESMAGLVQPANGSLAMPWAVEVDDEDGTMRTLCCYRMLPLYGRPPLVQPTTAPSVLVSISCFGKCHRWQENRYNTGLSQIIKSLPHLARRIDVHLAVFVDDDMLKNSNRWTKHPRVTFVPTKWHGMAKTLDRFRWHDPEALRTEGLLQLGLARVPDVVMTWDADSLLDCAAFDWWVQQALQQPESFVGMAGNQNLGPNNLPRRFNAGTFAVTPKSMPAHSVWPHNTNSLHEFLVYFLKDKKIHYGIDEEALSYMLDDVVSRGHNQVYMLDMLTSGSHIIATTNTGEDCDDEDDNGVPTYDIWVTPRTS